MKIYVVRHGESETNKNGLWTGWHDALLTEKGREDALKARKVLKGVPFDKIYTSDLSRAIETAKIAIPDCQFETTELVREINVGTLANTPINSLTAEQKAYAFNNGYSDYDGESRQELQDRIRVFMKKVEHADCQNIAVFTHAGWMLALLNEVLGEKVDRSNIRCYNCAVAIFECDAGQWRLHSWINHV